MSGLLDAMTTLLHPKHGRCDIDLHKGKEKVSHSHTINSGNQISSNNTDENDEHANNKNNGSDDVKGNHRHTPCAINKPEIVSEK